MLRHRRVHVRLSFPLRRKCSLRVLPFTRISGYVLKTLRPSDQCVKGVWILRNRRSLNLCIPPAYPLRSSASLLVSFSLLCLFLSFSEYGTKNVTLFLLRLHSTSLYPLFLLLLLSDRHFRSLEPRKSTAVGQQFFFFFEP